MKKNFFLATFFTFHALAAENPIVDFGRYDQKLESWAKSLIPRLIKIGCQGLNSSERVLKAQWVSNPFTGINTGTQKRATYYNADIVFDDYQSIIQLKVAKIDNPEPGEALFYGWIISDENFNICHKTRYRFEK